MIENIKLSRIMRLLLFFWSQALKKRELLEAYGCVEYKKQEVYIIGTDLLEQAGAWKKSWPKGTATIRILNDIAKFINHNHDHGEALISLSNIDESDDLVNCATCIIRCQLLDILVKLREKCSLQENDFRLLLLQLEGVITAQKTNNEDILKLEQDWRANNTVDEIKRVTYLRALRTQINDKLQGGNKATNVDVEDRASNSDHASSVLSRMSENDNGNDLLSELLGFSQSTMVARWDVSAQPRLAMKTPTGKFSSPVMAQYESEKLQLIQNLFSAGFIRNQGRNLGYFIEVEGTAENMQYRPRTEDEMEELAREKVITRATNADIQDLKRYFCNCGELEETDKWCSIGEFISEGNLQFCAYDLKNDYKMLGFDLDGNRIYRQLRADEKPDAYPLQQEPPKRAPPTGFSEEAMPLLDGEGRKQKANSKSFFWDKFFCCRSCMDEDDINDSYKIGF